MKPIDLDDSMAQPNWRENPLLLLGDEANDALEVVFLRQIRDLDFYFSKYLGQPTCDPASYLHSALPRLCDEDLQTHAYDL